MVKAPMIDTSYEPFSRQPEYIQVNRGFINTLPLRNCQTVLDLACGTGTLTDLLLEVDAGRQIIGVDLSHESLNLARQHFMDSGHLDPTAAKPSGSSECKTPRLLFFQSTADCLPFADQSVDAAVMGNAIHNLPNQDILLQEIHRVLKPKALFAFNSSFFAGTYPAGTEHLYHEWLKIALKHIMTKNRELRSKGLKGITRKRGTGHRAFSKQWPTPEEWSRRLMQNGFGVQWYCHRTIMMNRRSLETVGAYAGLAGVLLSGYPVEIACEALEAAAGPAFESAGMQEVRRLWLEVAAVKK
jgi:ubiquinone/menaquinone biosynthesis C-methylase UbiE